MDLTNTDINKQEGSNKAASFFSAALLVACMLLPFVNFAQNKQHKHIQSNLMLEGKAAYGFLIPHRLEMESMNAHFPSFEINLSKKTDGQSRWEYMYDYPIVGMAYWYSNIGKSPYLGDAHALFPYINFALTPNKPTRIYFRTGVGLAYLTKSFHRIDNYKNIAVGSNLNAAVSISLELRARIMERMYLTASVGLMHFSNGSMKTPNYGLNIPSASAGFVYKLTKENPYKKSKILPELYPYEFDGKKFFQLQFGAGMGYKNMDAEIGGRYLVYAIYANIMKQVSFKNRFGISLDASYDGTDRAYLNYNSEEKEERFLPMVKTGGAAAWEVMISRVSLMFNVGVYFSGAYQSEGTIYEKLAIWYYFNQNIYASLTLKAHYARADYITFGLGYNLNIKYY